MATRKPTTPKIGKAMAVRALYDLRSTVEETKANRQRLRQMLIGLTDKRGQRERLAKTIGITGAHLRNVLDGRRELTLDLATKLVEVL
jgi:hypothetical protein